MHFTSHYSTPHHIKRFHITHHSITPHQTILHRNTFHVSPFHTTPFHITPPLRNIPYHITTYQCPTPHLGQLMLQHISPRTTIVYFTPQSASAPPFHTTTSQSTFSTSHNLGPHLTPFHITSYSTPHPDVVVLNMWNDIRCGMVCCAGNVVHNVKY